MKKSNAVNVVNPVTPPNTGGTSSTPNGTAPNAVPSSVAVIPDPSIAVLNQTPTRVLPFLRAMATRIEVRVVMAANGYTEEEQLLGWKLLLSATGYKAPPMPITDDARARASIAELDAWDEPGFRRIHAALGRLYPDQDAFVFAGLEPSTGPGAVLSVATLLDRLDALESSPARAAKRDGDQAALATLARRGVDKNERNRLRALVTTAQQAKIPVMAIADPSIATARDQALRDLYAWYNDWSQTAHAVIRRRDHLLLMGLAKAKRSKADPVVPGPSPAPAPSPVPAPVPSSPTTIAPVTTSQPSA